MAFVPDHTSVARIVRGFIDYEWKVGRLSAVRDRPHGFTYLVAYANSRVTRAGCVLALILEELSRTVQIHRRRRSHIFTP